MSDQRYKILCRKKLSDAQVKEFAVMIKEEYRVNVVADNLPVGVISSSEQDALGEEDSPGKETIANFYEMGYPVTCSFFLRGEGSSNGHMCKRARRGDLLVVCCRCLARCGAAALQASAPINRTTSRIHRKL